MLTDQIRCYSCKKNSVEKAFDKLGWTILKCNNCSLFRLKFTGSYDQFIKRYYSKGFFTGSKDRAGYFSYEGDRKAEGKNMQAYLQGVKRFKSSGKLLDVGCATGLFMLEAKGNGFDVYGVDVSDYAVKIAKSRFGRKVKNSSIEQVSYKSGSFDVITLFDVIEHLKDPIQVLKKLGYYLKDDGIIVINTGDADSLLAKIQGKDWHYFIPPQHFFYFSKNTLTDILEKAGFKVIQVDRKGKWLTLRYLFHLARQIQQDAIGKIGFALVGRIAPGKIPIYLNLFDNITVYAAKQGGKQRKTTT